jgi:hypothetical protein
MGGIPPSRKPLEAILAAVREADIDAKRYRAGGISREKHAKAAIR